LSEAVEYGDQALNIAREIDWRSGEIYALECLSNCLGPQGNYPRALELAKRALEISEEIEHDQWTVSAHFGLGALYLDLLAMPQARQHLEQAYLIAQELGSSVWIGSVTGYLASICILQADFSRAEALLDVMLSSDTPTQTQMQRLCWCARAELALAQADPELALSIIDHLIASDPNTTPANPIPRLWKLRGETLFVLQRLEEAEKALLAAQNAALTQNAHSWSWRIHLALGKLYQAQSRSDEAAAEYNAGRKNIIELTALMQDHTLRDNLLESVIKMIPPPFSTSSRKIKKEKFGGLTAREREVASLIAQGQSNREIATALIISERTVESHVTNILSKLGFTSRAHITVWAMERGLGT
jgi:DNA-binding CsgD family transcriptional regulator/tetratricopeptide (TPR) repeat protein